MILFPASLVAVSGRFRSERRHWRPLITFHQRYATLPDHMWQNGGGESLGAHQRHVEAAPPFLIRRLVRGVRFTDVRRVMQRM